MGESTPVSDPENISTMKFLLAVALFATLACALAEPEPEAYRGYYGYRGYGYRGYGYRGYYRGKRPADAEAEAEAEPYSGYGYGYRGYYGRPYGYGYRYFG